jgi:lipopolysaccharide/colanic/teichoic acid biosynthesis glycosyltransferase
MSADASSGAVQLTFPPAVVFSAPPLSPDVTTPGARPVKFALKRAFDIVVVLLVLPILSPIFALLALAVRLDGGPALYGHTRIGYNDRPFKCLKFRTMSVAADAMLAEYLAANPAAALEWARQRKLVNDPRITRLGAILRKTSLDELPQLFNVLRGEMSLVGPRPVVREELEEHYGRAGRIAYSAMRPGITGLWQVSGRSETSYRERVTLDITYGSRWCLLLDFKILLLTVPAVLARRGAV